MDSIVQKLKKVIDLINYLRKEPSEIARLSYAYSVLMTKLVTEKLNMKMLDKYGSIISKAAQNYDYIFNKLKVNPYEFFLFGEDAFKNVNI